MESEKDNFERIADALERIAAALEKWDVELADKPVERPRFTAEDLQKSDRVRADYEANGP